MTFLTEAGERFDGRMREMVRDPTGVDEPAEDFARALVQSSDTGAPFVLKWLGRNDGHGANLEIKLAQVNRRAKRGAHILRKAKTHASIGTKG
jgi:hypothetical protein